MQQITRPTILASILLLFAFSAIGQEGNSINTYSPYTLYGVGDLYEPGFALNKGMGGITIGMRDPLSINYYNPAALSVQDTLSFLFDFGVRQKNMYSKTNTARTSANNFNLDHIALSFRISHGLGIGMGITPYSDIGYDIEQRATDPNEIYEMGSTVRQYKGEGGINQVFVGLGYQLGKKLSVGANMMYYFGDVDRYYNIVFVTNPNYSQMQGSNKVRVGRLGFSTGAQYVEKLKEDLNLVVGATFRPKTSLAASQEVFSSVVTPIGVDTVTYNTHTVNDFFAPMEIGFGVTISKTNKLTIGADYLYQDWADFNINGSTSLYSFRISNNQSFKLGFDYTPNIFDIKNPLKRWSYRGGLYYTNSYMICNGKRINDYGITFGVGIPIRTANSRWGTKFNAAIAVGQRGTTSNELIKENYVSLTLSASIFELWFIKYKYQ